MSQTNPSTDSPPPLLEPSEILQQLHQLVGQLASAAGQWLPIQESEWMGQLRQSLQGLERDSTLLTDMTLTVPTTCLDTGELSSPLTSSSVSPSPLLLLPPAPDLEHLFTHRRIPHTALSPGDPPEVCEVVHPARRIAAMQAAHAQANREWSRLLRIQRHQHALLVISGLGTEDPGSTSLPNAPSHPPGMEEGWSGGEGERVEGQMLQMVGRTLEYRLLQMAIASAKEQLNGSMSRGPCPSSPRKASGRKREEEEEEGGGGRRKGR